jgi:hypothetical protein
LALLDDIRTSLRITADVYDAEVRMLIDSALYDMERVGVNPALLQVDGEGELVNAHVKTAVTCYCKANFGYDVSEAERFADSYERIVCGLMNSSENIAAIAQLECEPEGEPDGEPEGDSEGEPEGGE